MKKFLTPLLFACAFALPSALHAAAFEGKVTMQITDGSGKKTEALDLDYKIKDQFVRMDMRPKGAKPGTATMGMIMDTKKEEMIMLMAEQKMYMVMSTANKGGAQTANRPAANAPATKPSEFKLEKTGETESILGYKCEKYLIKDGKTTMALWLASDLGDFGGFGSGAGGGMMGGGNALQNQVWASSLQGKSLFPMRVVGMDPAGKENFRMEVTAIEKQALPASEFAPPAGWQKFEIPGMGDMMRGMMGR